MVCKVLGYRPERITSTLQIPFGESSHLMTPILWKLPSSPLEVDPCLLVCSSKTWLTRVDIWPNLANQLLSPRNSELGSGKLANGLEVLKLGCLSHHVQREKNKADFVERSMRPVLPWNSRRKELSSFLEISQILHPEGPFHIFCPWVSMKSPWIHSTNSL